MNPRTPKQRVRKPRTPVTDEEIDRALEMLADGVPLNEVARTLDRGVPTLLEHGVRSGVRVQEVRHHITDLEKIPNHLTHAKLSITPQRDAGLTA